jgi:cytochrome P450
MLIDTAPTRASLPPGPRAPAFIQALMLLDEPLKLLQKAHRQHGDVFTMRYAGLGPVVHVTTPGDVRALFTADPDVAFAGEANYSLFGPIVGRGTLFTMEGAAHRKRRRLVMPSFHGEHIQEYATVMRDATRRAIRRWPLEKELALYGEMQTVTLEVILRAVFGLDDGSPETRELCELLAALSCVGIGSPYLLLPHLQLDLGPRSPWGRVMRLRRDTHRAMDREIARRRRDSGAAQRPDILSLLLQVRDEDGVELTDEQLRDELILLLIAGHETTATSLAWAFATILEDGAVVT